MFDYTKLKALRKATKLTQEQCAEFIGTDRTNYNRKENGKTILTVDELTTLIIKFSEYLTPAEMSTHLSRIWGFAISEPEPRHTTESDVVKDLAAALRQLTTQQAGNASTELKKVERRTGRKKKQAG